MIGIRHSELAAFFTCLSIATAAADNVILNGESQLTGTVAAISQNGGITLATPLSPEPLMLRGDSVRQINFSKRGESFIRANSRVTLVNGDILPGEVKSMDGATMTLTTSFAGELSLPRAMVDRLHLDVTPDRLIYQGPTTLEGWEVERWTCNDQVLASQGSGRVARAFDLPPQFIFRFKIAWKNHPNLQVGIAETSGDNRADRYVFQFTAGGIEIKRQNHADQKLLTLTTVNRPADQFGKSEMDVELRIDRTSSKLQVVINGQLEARIDDPVGRAPAGGGISFRSNAGGEATHLISKIQLLSWDSASARHRSEDRGDPKVDALIDDEGARYSGKLEAIRPSARGPSILFKSPLLDKPMEIPVSEVSTVFFAGLPLAEPAKPTLILKLQGGGELKAESCLFTGDRISVRHPLLGDLALNRASLQTVERPVVNTEAEKR